MNPTTSPPTDVGLIGVGLIGTALAERLIAGGFHVTGFDVAPSRREALAQLGGRPASSASSVFDSCPRVLLSLPDGDIARAVVTAALPSLRSGQIVIDTTTGPESTALEIAESLSARGCRYLDATISGNSSQVRRGEVTVLAGGDPEDFASCRDLFDTFARRLFHLGPVGSGARMKLVTNLVLGLNRAALAEGLAFGKALGFDLRQTLDVLRESPANSRMLELKGEKMVSSDFTPEARLAQHLKDVRLILEAAREAGARMPLGTAHLGILEEAVNQDLGSLDNSAILRVFLPASPKSEPPTPGSNLSPR